MSVVSDGDRTHDDPHATQVMHRTGQSLECVFALDPRRVPRIETVIPDYTVGPHPRRFSP